MATRLTPEVGDLISVLDPRMEEFERAEHIRVIQVEVVEVREPGFFVVRDLEQTDPAADSYAILTEAPLTVTKGYRPVEYEAQAWIEREGETPKRTGIVKLWQRYEVEAGTRARMVLHDEDEGTT